MDYPPSNGNATPQHELAAERPAAGPDADVDLDIGEVIGVFVRRWPVLLAALLGCSMLAAVYNATAPRVYSAITSVLVDAQGRDASPSDLPVLDALTAMTRSRSVQTQAEIIRSRPIIDKALARLGESLAATIEVKGIQVKPLRETDVIEVCVPATSPEGAAAMANAIAEGYIADSQARSGKGLADAVGYVQGQLRVVRSELSRAQDDLRRFKEANLTADLPSETVALVSLLTQLHTDRRVAQVELAAARTQLRARQVAGVRMQSGYVENAGLARSDIVAAIKTRLVELELQRTATAAEYVPSSPEVRAISRQIDDARQRLSEEAAVATAQDIAALQAAVWVAETKEEALRRAEARANQQLRRLPAIEYRLALLATETQASAKTFELLNEKYQQLRIGEQARITSARVIAPAPTPIAPVSPKRALNLVIGMVTGLLMGIALVLLTERLDDRVHSEDEATKATGVPVLSVVRRARAGEPFLLKSADIRSDLLETFRTLRTNITFSAVDEPLRAIAILSSRPSEGKTSVACNLAVALALDGKRTILVDGDLRRPRVHERFGCRNEFGMSQVAVGQANVESVLQATETANLQLVTSGPVPPNPSELLNSGHYRRAFARLHELADCIVVDTPPLTMFTDGQLEASLCDAAVIVVSASETNARHLKQSRRLLEVVGTRLLGIVLNKADRHIMGTGYYSNRHDRKYGYYGHYHDDDKSNGSGNDHATQQ